MNMIFWVALLASPVACAGEASPISKVKQLLSDLQTKIIAEGEKATKTYQEFSEWCEDRSKNLGFEIKTGKAQVEQLSASIDKETATVSSLDAKLEELAASIAANEADLKSATLLRGQEAKEFSASEAELQEVISALQRAIGILEREMQKTGSFVQLSSAGSVVDALGALVQASALSAADAKQLTALVQQAQQTGDNDAGTGAPDAAVYQGQSRGIIDTLEDLLEKAESQLAEARKKEAASKHEFEMLKQSLEDEMKFTGKEMAGAKKGIAAAGEQKAADAGDLKVTSTALQEDLATLAGLHHSCMLTSQEYEAQTKSRTEELKALAAARAAIASSTKAAVEQTYGLNQMAFVQISRSGLSTRTDLANFEAVHLVRDLARKQGSAELAQLAARMSSALRAGGEDPFAKVKGLIREMVERLEATAAAEASHKAYCDKELAETHAKKGDKSSEIEKLSTRIDMLTAGSAKLKEEVAMLETALTELAKSQAEMDKLRAEEKEAFLTATADLKEGLEGVQSALKILREYYSAETEKAHTAAEGAGSSVIGLLEVVQSDFERGLVERKAAEEEAASVYEKGTKENQLEKTSKSQDVKYKAKEASDLAKAAAELSSDRASVDAELSAVMDYLKSLEAQCIAKAETYESRQARYEAEVAGLKEALKILNGQAMLLQKGGSRTLRVQVHHQGTVA